MTQLPSPGGGARGGEELLGAAQCPGHCAESGSTAAAADDPGVRAVPLRMWPCEHPNPHWF